MSEWISVEERLPEEGDLVLAYQKGERIRVDYIVLLEGEILSYIWGNFLVDDWDKTSHWMPCPKPPANEDE